MSNPFFRLLVIFILIPISLPALADIDELPDSTVVENVDSVALPDFYNKTAKEGLMEALEYFDIKFPEIVYCQAVVESGNFRSKLSTEGNNIFGLRGRSGYYHYPHWVDSVIAYKEKIQNRYREGEDYYSFLKRIRYATSPAYIPRLKKMVKERTEKN